MRPNEVCPVHLLAALGSRGDTEPAQDIADGLIGNAMAEILYGAANAIVSPAAILTSHADDELRDFSSDRRSSRVGAVFRAIELAGDQLAIPSQDGLRLGDRGNRLERLTPESLTDFRQSRPLRVIQWDVRRQE